MQKFSKSISVFLLHLLLVFFGFVLVMLSSCEKDDPQPEYGVPSGKYVNNTGKIMESSGDYSQY